jgi:hypothetical protein
MTPAQFWQIEQANQQNQQQNQQEQQRYNQKMIMDGLMQLGGAVAGMVDEKAMSGAMDKAVGLMSDIEVIKPEIRDSFMNLERREKPLVFDLLRQGMFAPYAAGQSAGFQAQAWDKYRQGGANTDPQSRNKYGYRYQGP